MRALMLTLTVSAAVGAGLAVAPNVVLWSLLGIAFIASLRDRGVRR